MVIIPYFSVHNILMAMLPIQSVSYFYFSRHKWNISSLALHKTVIMFGLFVCCCSFVFIFVGSLVVVFFFQCDWKQSILSWERSWGCDVTSVPAAPVTRCNLPFSLSFICLCEKTWRAFREFTSHAHRRFRHTCCYADFKPWRIQRKISFFSFSVFFFP